MEATILFVVSVIASLIVWSKISAKYFWPRLRNMDLKKAAQPILLMNAFRFAGLSFLVPGVVHAGLSPVWALPAAYGDFAAAVLAFVALLSVNSTSFRPLLWLFNIVGSLDLLLAFIDGPRYGILPFLGPAYYIIVLFVPMLVVGHLTVFRLLQKE